MNFFYETMGGHDFSSQIQAGRLILGLNFENFRRFAPHITTQLGLLAYNLSVTFPKASKPTYMLMCHSLDGKADYIYSLDICQITQPLGSTP